MKEVAWIWARGVTKTNTEVNQVCQIEITESIDLIEKILSPPKCSLLSNLLYFIKQVIT